MSEPIPAPAPELPPKVYRPSVRGSLGRVGAALATFALLLVVMRAVAAPGGGSVIGGKLEYWREHGSDYDTVFVGSSHVFRAFVPSEFDRAAAELGVTSHSFNFGVQAVQLLEARYLLHAVLAAQPGLERVLFEYQWLSPQIDPQNSFSPRTVYWHDRETTGLAMERALHWGGELGERFQYIESESQRHSFFTVVDRLLPPGPRSAEEHLQHFLTDRFLIGRGKDVLRGLLGREHGQTARYRAENGYLSLEDDDRELASQGDVSNSYVQRRARFLANQPAYLRDVDALDSRAESFGDGEWINAEVTRVDDFDLIANLAREVRARGIEFVLVILPSQSGNRPFEEHLLQDLGSLVLRYNLPERYEALYDPANRYDSGHLSAEGARYFSRLLARDYAGQHGSPRDGEPAASEVAQ